MSIKTSDVEFKLRIRQQIEDPIMRKAVANAQERIGANRQKMVDELGHWDEWRDRASQIRDHVLSNLDAYLYQLTEKVTENGGHVYFAKTKEEATRYILQVAQSKKRAQGSEVQVDGDRRDWRQSCIAGCRNSGDRNRSGRIYSPVGSGPAFTRCGSGNP